MDSTTMTATTSPSLDTITSSPLSSLSGNSPPSSPSSPLSNLSKTPSLPGSPELESPHTVDPSQRYPSPMSSTAPSGTQSPLKTETPTTSTDSGTTKKIAHRARVRADQGLEDGSPRPLKKRKMTTPKERRTDHIDLTKPQDEWTTEDEGNLARLMTALHKKKKIVVVAGAGISVSAGIPDFRSSTGLFAPAGSQQQKMKASGKHLFDASVYKHDASTQSFHTMVREMADMSQKAKPTPFHHLLASLAQEGRLLRLYSQNIDCIDTSMKPLATNVPLNTKGPWPTTVQLHGGLEKMVCTKCAELKPFNGELFDGPQAPLCEACKELDTVRTAHGGKRSHGIGRLRPRFVLYNEYNPDEEAIGNVSSADLKARPDAILVVGTSLKVPGTRRLVKELCQVTRGRRDGLTAFINTDSEPKGVDFKDCWDLVVRATCDKVALEAGLTPWDCKVDDNCLMSPDDILQKELRLHSTKLQVGIPHKQQEEADIKIEQPDPAPKVKAVDEAQAQAMPTPRPSPKLSAVRQAGKKNPKQTKLPFASGKEETAKKPRSTKSRKPLKTAKPTNTVSQTFKAVKGTTTDNTTLTAVKKTTTSSNALPKLEHVDKVVELLPSLRPERRASADNFIYSQTTTSETINPSAGDSSSIEPSTPVQAERPVSRDTISPKSVPKGLNHLIDVQ